MYWGKGEERLGNEIEDKGENGCIYRGENDRRVVGGVNGGKWVLMLGG